MSLNVPHYFAVFHEIKHIKIKFRLSVWHIAAVCTPASTANGNPSFKHWIIQEAVSDRQVGVVIY